MSKEKNAKGTKGMIITTCTDSYFRVYEEDGRFTDYDLLHPDLSVIIDDDDAVFRDGCLDVSNKTLGIEE